MLTSFKVNGVDAVDNTVTVAYTGKTIKPDILVSDGNGTALTLNDYKIEYYRSEVKTLNLYDKGTITIIITPKYNIHTAGTTNVSGSLTMTLIIE